MTATSARCCSACRSSSHARHAPPVFASASLTACTDVQVQTRCMLLDESILLFLLLHDNTPMPRAVVSRVGPMWTSRLTCHIRPCIHPSCGLDSYGLDSYGLNSYGLYRDGLYGDGLYSYGLGGCRGWPVPGLGTVGANPKQIVLGGCEPAAGHRNYKPFLD